MTTIPSGGRDCLQAAGSACGVRCPLKCLSLPGNKRCSKLSKGVSGSTCLKGKEGKFKAGRWGPPAPNACNRQVPSSSGPYHVLPGQGHLAKSPNLPANAQRSGRREGVGQRNQVPQGRKAGMCRTVCVPGVVLLNPLSFLLTGRQGGRTEVRKGRARGMGKGTGRGSLLSSVVVLRLGVHGGRGHVSSEGKINWGGSGTTEPNSWVSLWWGNNTGRQAQASCKGKVPEEGRNVRGR